MQKIASKKPFRCFYFLLAPNVDKISDKQYFSDDLF